MITRAVLAAAELATHGSRSPRACARRPSGLHSRAAAAWASQCSPGASPTRRSRLLFRCVLPSRYQDAVHEQHLQSQLVDAKQKLALDQAGCGPRPHHPRPRRRPRPRPHPTLTPTPPSPRPSPSRPRHRPCPRLRPHLDPRHRPWPRHRPRPDRRVIFDQVNELEVQRQRRAEESGGKGALGLERAALRKRDATVRKLKSS